MTGTRQKYFVDWSTPNYPEIKVWEYGDTAKPLTLTEAKAEIDAHCAKIIDHWKDIRQLFRRALAQQIHRGGFPYGD